MSLSVLGEYAKISWRLLHVRINSFSYSQNAFKYFPRILGGFCVPQITPSCHILHVRINSYCVFSEYASILSVHSTQALKYFPRILPVRRKKFSISTMPGDFKGTAFQKNLMGGYILSQDEQFKNLIFWISLKLTMLYAYTENMRNGKINSESVYISVNNNTNFKKFRFFLSSLYGID